MRTKENIEKKHALTYDEIVQEREDVLFSNPVNSHPNTRALYLLDIYAYNINGEKKSNSYLHAQGKQCMR